MSKQGKSYAVKHSVEEGGEVVATLMYFYSGERNGWIVSGSHEDGTVYSGPVDSSTGKVVIYGTRGSEDDAVEVRRTVQASSTGELIVKTETSVSENRWVSESTTELTSAS